MLKGPYTDKSGSFTRSKPAQRTLDWLTLIYAVYFLMSKMLLYKSFLSKMRPPFASESKQLLLGITLEPRPRASDTIMNYSSEFMHH